MNTPAATPPENTEILPAGFKIDRDQLKTDVSIAYEKTPEGITARFSTVHNTQNRRTKTLMAATGMTTGETRAEARQKVINALAAAMVG